MRRTHRRAKSNPRLAVDIGDRVIVKEKYLGTCKYIGPLLEKFIVPDIFIGVQLDEPHTSNSGIFGSRQYFDCPYGYGLMVSADKVRKVAPEADKAPDKLRASPKRSKSVADLSRQLNAKNWHFDERPVKVSTGFRNSLSRSKSSSNLSNLDNVHPREVLSKVKRYQPHFTTPPPSDLQKNPTLFPTFVQPYQQTRQNSGFTSFFQPHYGKFGLPLHYPQKTQDVRLPESELLRHSFQRIVVPSRSPPPLTVTSPYPGFFPYQQRISPVQSSTSLNSSLYDTRSDSGYPTEAHNFYQDPESSENSKNFNRIRTFGKKELEPEIGSDWLRRLPMCATCAACPTCAPRRAPTQSPYTTPIPAYRTLSRPTPISNSEPFHILTPKDKQQRKMSAPCVDDLRAMDLKKFIQMNSEVKRNDFAPEMSEIGIEYEKWKARHGITMGRSMKKGLSKLHNASLQYHL